MMQACRSFVERYGAVHMVCTIIALLVLIGALVEVAIRGAVEKLSIRFKCSIVVIVIVQMAKLTTPPANLVGFHIVDVIIRHARRLNTMVTLAVIIAATSTVLVMIRGTSRVWFRGALWRPPLL